MTDSVTEPAAVPEPDAPATRHGAVIAIPTGYSGGFHGRYLHHAPGPAATVELLRELFATRYRGRRGNENAVRELIIEHPSGWARLGTATSRDKEIKPRRAPARLGQCYCHHPDGTPHPALIAAALATVRDAEMHENTWTQVPHGQLGDGTPWKIRSGAVPDAIDFVYVFSSHGLAVKARDGARDRSHRFEQAIAFTWDQPPAPEQIEHACRLIRSRTTATLADEKVAGILADTARQLAAIPADHDLVLHLLGGASRYLSLPDQRTPEAALARAADVRPTDLADLLRRADRDDQVRLLQRAAHDLAPTTYPAP